MDDHLLPGARALIGCPIDDRLAYFRKDSWIPYPRGDDILRHLEDLLRYPRCERMPNLAVSAPTNNGKTRLLRHFMSLHPGRENPTGEAAIIPALYLQCPGVPDESRLYDSLLTMLCERFKVSASPREKLRLVLDVLQKVDLRLLIVDEVNYAESGSADRQKTFLNALRYLGGELQISIATAGTEEMMRVIRTIPAVENRFVPKYLPVWDYNQDFRQLLASFEQLIPLEEPSGLSGKALASRIHARCGGTIGELKMLLGAAAEHAMRNEQKAITIKVIDGCAYVSPAERKRARVPG